MTFFLPQAIIGVKKNLRNLQLILRVVNIHLITAYNDYYIQVKLIVSIFLCGGKN